MAKKGYKRPKIERVKLVAEEAVLTNCKGPFQLGPGQAPGQGGGPSLCFNVTGEVCQTQGS